MHYTQDESYYLLDAEPGAQVYLGLKDGIDRAAMERDLRAAQAGSGEFSADVYVNQFPARPQDHFLIPAGTIHCSGKDSMVLEISATPYIFTFKLWDWGRVSALMVDLARFTSNTVSRTFNGTVLRHGRARTSSTKCGPLQRATDGARRPLGYTNASLSRRGVIGSPGRYHTIPTGASMY